MTSFVSHLLRGIVWPRCGFPWLLPWCSGGVCACQLAGGSACVGRRRWPRQVLCVLTAFLTTCPTARWGVLSFCFQLFASRILSLVWCIHIYNYYFFLVTWLFATTEYCWSSSLLFSLFCLISMKPFHSSDQCLHFTWYVRFCPVATTPPTWLDLRKVSCRQHMLGLPMSLIYADQLCCVKGGLNRVQFNVVLVSWDSSPPFYYLSAWVPLVCRHSAFPVLPSLGLHFCALTCLSGFSRVSVSLSVVAPGTAVPTLAFHSLLGMNMLTLPGC